MPSRVGVYICHCGINIAATVNSAEVAAYAATLPHVAVACPFCLLTLEDAVKTLGLDDKIQVMDIMELVAQAM